MGAAIDAHPLRFRLQALRESWQGRTLRYARGKTAAVLLSVIAHNFEKDLRFLLHAVFPGFIGVRAPFFCSAGFILENGAVTADLISRGGSKVKRWTVFKSETEMQDTFRRLADDVKLPDAERTELFDALKRWIVCDFRLDPNMDPKDPDARHYRQ